MTATTVRRPPVLAPDRDLPGATDLLAGAGSERVARFLSERGLEPHTVEPAQAHYRPGRWMIVCFRTAATERSSGRPHTPTVTVECRAGEPDSIWAFPDDPALPGLARAFDAEALLRRLRPRPATVEVQPLRYRPRRRAVLRYRVLLPDGGPAGRAEQRVLYGKVLLPRRARRLLSLAEALRPAEPAGPAGLRLALPVGRLSPGAVLVPGLAGTPLRDLLIGGGVLPAPGRLALLPSQLHERCVSGCGPNPPGALRRRVDATTALGSAHTVARLLPDQACTAARIAEAVINRAEEEEPVDDRIVHGDLYENQILVDGARLGLLDLDDLGPGDPLLDAANFTAHLLLLGTSNIPNAPRILRYREELRTAFCHHLDATHTDLAWRESYCLLKLATGPFRVLHPAWPTRMTARLQLARQALAVKPA